MATLPPKKHCTKRSRIGRLAVRLALCACAYSQVTHDVAAAVGDVYTFEDLTITERSPIDFPVSTSGHLINGWAILFSNSDDTLQADPPAYFAAPNANTIFYTFTKDMGDGTTRSFVVEYPSGTQSGFPLSAVIAADGDPTPTLGNDNPDVPPDSGPQVVGRYDRSGITITEVVETQDQGLDLGGGWVAITGTGEPFAFNGFLYPERGDMQLTIAKYATDGTLRTFHVAWPPDNVQGVPLTDPLDPLAIPFGAAVIEGGPTNPEPYVPTSGLENPTGANRPGALVADQANDIPDSCCPFTFEDNEYEFTEIAILLPPSNAHPTQIASHEEAVEKLRQVAERCGGEVVLFTVANESSGSGVFAEGTSYYAAVMIEDGHCDGDPTSLDDCSYCDPECPRYDSVACEITGGQVYPPGQGDSLELNALDLVPTPCGVRGDFDFDGICNGCDANNGDWVQLQTRDIAGSDVQVCFWYMDGYNNRDWVYHGGPQQVHSAIPLVHCLPICGDENDNGVCDSCEQASDTPGGTGNQGPGATYYPDREYEGAADDCWARLYQRLRFTLGFGGFGTLCHPVRVEVPSISGHDFGIEGVYTDSFLVEFDTCFSDYPYLITVRTLARRFFGWVVNIYAFWLYFRFALSM